ncbi:tRNA (adenosine(37)-N6)-threonylcarbamoyltransferase complex ATPase subunit type 1 TsaE [Yeosuana marina]|uniref:tRNA (adenosine(37)-N6)-threonylcarbamoyltransferase complex ATPase subunit type 1 TsaE n=1 Tax=Yeosuana marina TaxID=1565536 RepID=UPI0030EB4DD3|tara:strand:+ start:163 stop:591 length:429 start_codon:yes stop_codon:yes gene_type:complete
MQYTLNSIHEVAKQIITCLNSKIIIIYGDMGAGKTTLIKALVKALGSDDEVSSPTFSIVNEYTMKDDTIFHFDLYRIKDLEEAYNFGIEDYIFSKHWVIIEWPEIVESVLPDEIDRIDLTLQPDNSRLLKLNFKTDIDKQIC